MYWTLTTEAHRFVEHWQQRLTNMWTLGWYWSKIWQQIHRFTNLCNGDLNPNKNLLKNNQKSMQELKSANMKMRIRTFTWDTVQIEPFMIVDWEEAARSSWSAFCSGNPGNWVGNKEVSRITFATANCGLMATSSQSLSQTGAVSKEACAQGVKSSGPPFHHNVLTMADDDRYTY